jgi:hypothetical protein
MLGFGLHHSVCLGFGGSQGSRGNFCEPVQPLHDDLQLALAYRQAGGRQIHVDARGEPLGLAMGRKEIQTPLSIFH